MPMPGCPRCRGGDGLLELAERIIRLRRWKTAKTPISD